MASAANTTRGWRVLHLEDSDEDAEITSSRLKAECPDCEIHRVQNEADLLAALRTRTFDFILSDFKLPGYDGFAALAAVRARNATIPFIFLSGTIAEEVAVQALELGATDYVLKDRAARLVPAIRRALEDARNARSQLRTEEELKETQQRLMQLADQSSEVFWFVEPRPEKVLYVSPAFERVWGLPPAALYADPRAWTQTIHAEDQARITTAYDACLTGDRRNFEEEYRIIRPDGAVRWVLDSGTAIRDSSGRPSHLSGIAKDVTDRRLAAARIREQAELLDKARDAIVVANLDQRIAYWNRGAERIFGWTATEALGRHKADLFGRDSVAQIEAAQLGTVSDEWVGELAMRDKAGQTHTVESSITLIRDSSGRAKSHLLILTDITEKKLLEKKFMRAQRLESIGILAGGIAHDLNNALAPIMMSVNLLQLRLPDPELQRFFGVLETSARHGAGLIRQVLSFARGTEGVQRELLLPPVVREVVSLLSETLPRAIRVETDLAPDLAPITADPTEMTQVLMNLGVNARDAMPAGGCLRFSARNVAVDDALARINPGARSGPHVLLTVEDTGTGIPSAIIDRIFDPFFTTKEQGKGTGLGLSTVLGIVRSSHGFLQVESRPDQGTCFSLYFPAVADAATPDRRSDASPPPTGAGETILLIDDEAGVREIGRELLLAFGYRPIVAEDGATGLALFARHSAEIRAVLTDIHMPGMQGPEVIARLRALNPALSIVAMSGLVTDLSALKVEPGRLVVLQKPMTGNELLTALRSILPQPTRNQAVGTSFVTQFPSTQPSIS